MRPTAGAGTCRHGGGGLSRLIVDDVSPERLATLLRDHGGRIAVLSAEGDIFDVMAGRYSKGGVPNLGVFLKGHAGDPSGLTASDGRQSTSGLQP